MRHLARNLAGLLALLAAACVLAMMLLTAFDVTLRWMALGSLPGAQEATESLMVAIVYLGLAYALHKREHVAVTLVTSVIPAPLAAWLRIAGMIVMCALVAWMIWRTGWHAWRSFTIGEVRFGLLQIPIWPARASIPTGLSAFLLVALVRLVDEVRAAFGGRPHDDTHPRQDFA